MICVRKRVIIVPVSLKIVTKLQQIFDTTKSPFPKSSKNEWFLNIKSLDKFSAFKTIYYY